MVVETLGSMGGASWGSAGRITGKMDVSGGGRVMADTTSIFVLDTYLACVATLCVEGALLHESIG